MCFIQPCISCISMHLTPICNYAIYAFLCFLYNDASPHSMRPCNHAFLLTRPDINAFMRFMLLCTHAFYASMHLCISWVHATMHQCVDATMHSYNSMHHILCILRMTRLCIYAPDASILSCILRNYVKPKGMTLYRKLPRLVTKAVLSRSASLMGKINGKWLPIL